MDLLKYLAPMKNMPERFSNLAFWRGVRKLKDEVVSAFEYVNSWGENIERKLTSIPYHNQYPYQYVNSPSNVVLVPTQFKAPLNITKLSYDNGYTKDTYSATIGGIIAPSMPNIKLEDFYLNDIYISIYLHKPDDYTVFKQWAIHTNTAIKSINVDENGYVKSFDMMPSLEAFTIADIDEYVATGKELTAELAFNVLWKRP